MRIDRDVYEHERNEIEQQFAQHNLEKDMEEAARKGPPILSKKDVQRRRIDTWLALAVLIGSVAWLCYILGAF
jgi:hypothetical protein